ncbi:DUF6538 domain-containing protein [Methylobacterium terricola]|uniref:DUF6538 domain-containing protein n=1 Tax=Methylobacterium terricola TaxID=2583531 RepID=UPI003CCC5F7B
MPLSDGLSLKHHNGVYSARKDVPAHLRPLVGKWTVLVRLGTKDPAEAAGCTLRRPARSWNGWPYSRPPRGR